MPIIFLSLGSNLGDRGKHLQSALIELEQWGVKVLHASSIYETEPLGYGGEILTDQPKFYNMVVKAETSREPMDLLLATQAIERTHGRQIKGNIAQSVPPFARPLDIDILFYGDQILDVKDEVTSDDQRTLLAIPHPLLQKRKFVLVPLVEIAPDLVHPVLHKTIEQLLKECGDDSSIRLL